MRGGNEYPALIRKTEPKPLRIFLEDGLNDAWNPLFGIWYEENLLMESALNFAGYEVAHTWGRGGHDGKEATAIFPDVMRWLWKGWPSRVQRGNSLNNMLSAIQLKDSDWQEINLPDAVTGEIFADQKGNILFQNQSGKVLKLDSTNQISAVLSPSSAERLIGIDENDLYLNDSKGIIAGYSENRKIVIAKGIPNAKYLLATGKKEYYITQDTGENGSNMWLIKIDGTKRKINSLPFSGNHIAVYPSHQLLMQTEQHSQWIYSYIINNDGTIENGQRFYWLHNTENFDLIENGKMTFDEKGNMYVSSIMGVQVCDQNGRVRAILTLPTGQISSVAFGGSHHDVLYALSHGKVYCRKMNVHGVESWMTPMNPVSQGAG